MVARAHRMGATGEVTVQTIWLWEDDRDESLKKLNARLEKEQREKEEKAKEAAAAAAGQGAFGATNKPKPRAKQAEKPGNDDDGPGLVRGVFAAMRPPDAAEARAEGDTRDRVVRQAGGGEIDGSLSFLRELLTTPDIVGHLFIVGRLLISRGDLARLAFTCRGLRDAIRPLVQPGGQCAYLGLFQTPFGAEHRCKLHAHQHRSLRVMLAAEHPPGWRFGDMRGGILADDPGLGKTVTMMALITHTAGVLPQIPSEFYGEDMRNDWLQTRTNDLTMQTVLRYLVTPLRKSFDKAYGDAMAHAGMREANLHSETEVQALEGLFGGPMPARISGWRAAESAWAGAIASLQSLRSFDTLTAFEAAVRRCVRVGCEAVAWLCPKQMQMPMQKLMKETARGGLNTLRARLDLRQRSVVQSAIGRRMMFERNLLPVAATLVIVPAPLIEHWVEQFSRHVDLRSISRAEGASERNAVWIDGLGDAADIVNRFPFPKAKAPDSSGDGQLPSGIEFELANYSVVVTTYERCRCEHVRLAGDRRDAVSRADRGGDRYAESPLMKVRWLRLVCDEGHELGGAEQAEADLNGHRFVSEIAAERRWVMSGTPTVGEDDAGALTQLQRLLGFLRHPEYGLREGEAKWAKDVLAPVQRHFQKQRRGGRARAANA